MSANWRLARLLAFPRSQREFREGLSLYERLDLAGAEPHFREALAAAHESGSQNLVIQAAEMLYQVLRRRREDEEAIALLRELTRCHRRSCGAASYCAAAWRNETILVLARLGRAPEAEPECVQRLESVPSRHGEPSLAAGFALATLAWSLRGQQRWVEAVRAGEESLDQVQAAAGLETPHAGWSLVGLSVAWTRRGDLELAEGALRRAHANWDRVGRSELADATLDHLVDLYVVAERYADALAVSERRLLRTRRLATGSSTDRERRLWDIERHSFLLRTAGRVAEAGRFELRASVLRQGDGGRVSSSAPFLDPAGPVFEGEPLQDWGTLGPALPRAC